MADDRKRIASTKPSIRDYKDLQVWQKGMELAQGVHHLTGRFPSEEKFGLVFQMRRAAVSVPSNLAEVQARNTTGEFRQFISHAEGSLAELDTHCDSQLRWGFAANLMLNAWGR
jgi:four helix bundle protein